MTAEHILRQNAGKQPAEIVNALLRAGFAVVPLDPPPGTEGARMLRASKPFPDQWRAQVEQARVKL